MSSSAFENYTFLTSLCSAKKVSAVSLASTMLKSQCSSPVDRLCDLLLNWRIIDDMYSVQSKDQQTSTYCPVPTIFHDGFLKYLEIFEPLIIEEMKANVVNKILSNSRDDVMRGSLDIKMGKIPHNVPVYNICYSNFRKASSCGSKSRDPAAMDLVLITKDEVLSPGHLSASQPPCSYVLALVTSLYGSDGSRAIQLHTTRDTWDPFTTWLNCLSAVTTGASINKYSRTTGKPTSTLGSLDSSSNKAPSKNDWCSVNFMVLESLTSHWREYSALLQLKSTRLKRDILLGNPSLTKHPSNSTLSTLTESTTGKGSVVGSSPPTTTSDSLTVKLEIIANVPNNKRPLPTSPQFSDGEGGDTPVKQLAYTPAPALPHKVAIKALPVGDNADKKVRKKLRVTSKSNSHMSSLVGDEPVMNFHYPEVPFLFGFAPAFVTILNSNYNESQKEAIHRVTSVEKGFVLVQGPPGTGKTHTVMGMLNALHIREYDNFYTMAINDILGEPGLRCRESQSISVWLNFISSLSKYKPHILIAAPSNVAVDNVIQRIMEKGFIDGKGGQYFPTIVRLGSGGGNKNTKIKCVTLEETAEQIFSQSDKSRIDDLNAANAKVSTYIREICWLQTLLLSLRKAFYDFPLPMGWELRIDGKNCTVFWVDHVKQITSMFPPPTAVGGQINPELRHLKKYYSPEMLPEYITYVDSLSKTLDRLCVLNIQVKRMNALSVKHGKSLSHHELRNHVESSIIDEAHLVFSTLNSTGHASFDSTSFNVLVVDEAAQSTEMSSLIPLRLGCKKCVLVGDPCQLPATIFSPKLSKSSGMKYDRSLFERLTDSGQKSILLNTQYRMVPEISAFPSFTFYRGLLLDSDCVRGSFPAYIRHIPVEGKAALMEPLSVFPPFLFCDLLTSQDSVQQSKASGARGPSVVNMEKGRSFAPVSRSNKEEALCCVQLLKAIDAEAKRCGTKIGSVGVITPYQEQLVELAKCFREAAMMPSSNGELKEDSLDIEMNTVDGFQGREKDIVLISCVRANDMGSIGFLSDVRRMNVALTRSRFGLYVVGCAATLSANEHWGRLIKHAQGANSLVRLPSSSCDVLSLLRQLHEVAQSGTPLHEAARKENASLMASSQGSRMVLTSEINMNVSSDIVVKDKPCGSSSVSELLAARKLLSSNNLPVNRHKAKALEEVEDGEVSD